MEPTPLRSWPTSVARAGEFSLAREVAVPSW